MIALNKTDFTLLGQVALHCDSQKLQIAIQEAIQFDLKELSCDFFTELEINWGSTDEDWISLVNGGTYTNCRGNAISFQGLKIALIYFSYSRYIIINSYDDTPNGQVTKTNQFTLPKPLKEMEAYATKYKNLGLTAFNGSTAYLCQFKADTRFKSYDFTKCKICTCNACKPQTKGRQFGLRGQNITKF
jgi:hypothetical protein